MRTTRGVGLLAILALALAPSVQAQVELHVTPVVGGTFFLADPPSQFALHRTGGMSELILEDATFDDAWHIGINAGLKFDERWAVEAMFNWLPTELSATSGLASAEKLDAFMYGVNGFFFLPVDFSLKPYLSLGVGAETFAYRADELERHTDWMGNVAAGLFYAFHETAGVRFEARDCVVRFDSGIASVDDAWENDLMLSVGLSFIQPIR